MSGPGLPGSAVVQLFRLSFASARQNALGGPGLLGTTGVEFVPGVNHLMFGCVGCYYGVCCLFRLSATSRSPQMILVQRLGL